MMKILRKNKKNNTVKRQCCSDKSSLNLISSKVFIQTVRVYTYVYTVYFTRHFSHCSSLPERDIYLSQSAPIVYLKVLFCINFELAIKCQCHENNFVLGGYAGTQLFYGTNVGETIIKRHRCASIARNRASIGFY